MLRRYVVAYDENATHSASFFLDWHIAVSPPYILQPGVPSDGYQPLFVPGRTFALHHEVDLRTYDRPDFGPAFAPGLAEGGRMTLWSHGLAVGVIVELDEFRAVPDEHGVPGIQHQPYGRPQRLRPAFRWS